MYHLIDNHEWAMLQFSGGKDSLTCLYLLKPYWHKLKVYWVNTGAAYPETIAQMQDVAKLVTFVELKGDQPQTLERFGPPADVVPIRATPFGRWITQSNGPQIQSALDCCRHNIWEPLAKAVVDSKATLVIRGQRSVDKDKSPLVSGDIVDGVQYWLPIEDWTDEVVKDWMQSMGVALPDHYKYVNSSLDCWSCTAYREHVVGRMKYMKAHHPEMHQKVIPLLQIIDAAVREELSYVEEAMQ